MKLRIDQSLYYAKKEEFKSMYKALGLKWEEDTEYGNGWVSRDLEKRLIKLKPDGGFKRFFASNVDDLVTFLKGIGATEESEMDTENFVKREENKKTKLVEDALGRWVSANKETLERRGISIEVAIKFKRREFEESIVS